MESVLTKKQVKVFGPRPYPQYHERALIKATVRYDDQCGNGHNSFAITGEVYIPGHRDCETCGMLHEDIAVAFPELAPFLKWHLVSSDGPMHYLANTLYHAGDRDHNGLRKGETRQIRNGKTGLLAWQLTSVDADGNALAKDLPQYVDSATRPPAPNIRLEYLPWNIVGEGKGRELDNARSSAVWPDATDEELTSSDLEQRLKDRLPRLMAEFKQAIESLGFTY